MKNFRFFVLEECEKYLLNEKEKYYVDLLKTMNRKFGYNFTDGGKEDFSISEELSEKFRIRMLGNTIKRGIKSKDSTKIKISQSLIGNQRRTGILHDEKIKSQISKSEQGIKFGKNNKYVGVDWREPNKKWRARIKVRGTSIYLGYFLNENDAALAYNNAAIKYFGENAKLNIIDEDT
jgi:hypothetical protein